MIRLPSMRILVVALALAALGIFGPVGSSGCSSPGNTQFLPIGSHCGADGDCGTSPYTCTPTAPGGYCTKTCAKDGDCPTDAVCAMGACKRKCLSTDSATDGCRGPEGYVCRDEGAVSKVCDTP
jgi:hypothetical protein